MGAITVLGPVGIDGDAGGLSPRDRVVLAVLALRPGEAVPAERLADALWGEASPASWAKVVQGCVVRLRRALGARAIETTPGGYRLVVAADEVDAHRFERMVGRARELLTLGEAERAGYVAGEALALWQGRALVELEGWEAGRVEAGRLEELRLEAEELRLEAVLAAGGHGRVLAEAQTRVAEAPLRERRWALLALAQYQSGRQGEALRTLHRARAELARELGLDPGPELVGLQQAILRQDPSLLSAPAPTGEPDAACPWLGLVPYGVADAEAFFGRERDASACLRRLSEVGVLAVVGPSGSGKSSLVRAGVAAAAERDGRRVVVVTPGRRPMDALTALPASGPAPLLVVDQCEEALLCDDADERAEFFAALASHGERGGLAVALCAAGCDDIAAHPGFARLVERGLHLLGAMDEDDLRAAVEGPARQAGLLLEPGLVDLLVREVEGEPGALPLLSHALRQTWQRREGRTLTVDGYRDSGGIRGAVASTAEELYERVPAAQRPLLRDLLLRLVAPGPGGEPVRTRIPHRLLAADPEHERLIALLVAARLVTSNGDAVELAHEALIRAWPRLRGWLDDDVDGQRIRHHLAAAADAWDMMGQPEAELYRGARLAQALEWRDRAHPDLTPIERGFLDASAQVADAELKAAQERARHQARVNRRLRGLLAAVAAALLLVAGLALLAAGQTRRASEQARIAADNARVADEQAEVAEEQARIATARALAGAAVASLDTDPERSILLALEAVDATRQADGAILTEAEEALHRALRRLRLVYSVPQGHRLSLSGDGTRFVTAGQDGTAIVWDADSGQEVLTLSSQDLADARPFAALRSPIWTLAFSPDGRLITTSGDDGRRVWDAATGEQRYTVHGHANGVLGAGFSPDGRWLATVGWDHKAQIFDAETGAPRGALFGHMDWILNVTFSPDSTRAATASQDGTARIWDLASGEPIAVLTGHARGVEDVAFSPDGARIATASHDGTARIWDAESGARLVTFFGHTGPLATVDYSLDGRLIATGGRDATAKVWDAATGEQLLTLAGHTMGILDVAFTRDGRGLLTASADGTARLWDISLEGGRDWLTVPGTSAEWHVGVAFDPEGARFAAPRGSDRVSIWDARTGTEVLELTGHDAQAMDVAFSPDGRLLAASTRGGTVPVWDAATGELVLTLSGHRDAALAVAFSPDGSRIVTGSLDGRARLWHAVTGEEQQTLRTAQEGLRAVTFTPDGSYLATSDNAGAIAVWDAATLQRVSLFTHSPGLAVNGLAFTPDGRLVTSSDDGTAKVWDVESGEDLLTIAGHGAPINEVAVSPDGTLLATASDDGTAKLWDLATGRERLTLHGHDFLVHGVAFSPDGRLLATASPDGTVAVHLLPVDELVLLARERVTRALTDDECRRYLQLASCPPAAR